MSSVNKIAAERGVASDLLEIDRAEDIAASIAAVAGRVDALYVCADPLFNTHRALINRLALAARLPTPMATGNTSRATGCSHTDRSSPSCGDRLLAMWTRY